MQNDKIILDYWQHGLQQQALFSLTPTQIKDYWKVISSAECINGNLSNQDIINELLLTGPTMVVVPSYARQDDNYFIPYMLIVDLDSTGSFTPSNINPLPIIPKAVLEPSALCPISLGWSDVFDNHIILQPPEWSEDISLLKWDSQLDYAQRLLNAVTANAWQEVLNTLEYYTQDSALIFPLAAIYKPVHMDTKILKEKTKLELIDSERNSGKSAYTKSLIIDAWIGAAVKQSSPPKYVWLKSEPQSHYASIFDVVELKNNYQDNAELAQLKGQAQKTVNHYFNIYIKGRQVARNWQEMTKKIDDKYAEKGGIQARIIQLQAHLKDAHARNRHLQVLHSIWIRQCELVPAWSRCFDLIPTLQRKRLHRLYMFFKQNFPGEDVSGLSQKQLDEILLDKMRRAANSERFIADSLHQTENDVRQEELVRDKCLQWSVPQNEAITTLSGIIATLDNELWPKLLEATCNYWQLDFMLASGHDNFLSKKPDKIELLIIEHAEYVSPMQGAELLAISQRAIIMGNNTPICNPRFPVQVDYNLARHFKLVSCDEEFEDLQFEGIIASVGNLWNLASHNRDIDKTFPSQRAVKLHYEFIDVKAESEPYLGSRINITEANAILKWLQNNAELAADLAIYTTFSGQIEYIRNILANNKLAHIKVQAIQEPCFSKSAISLFTPVYTASDSTPYSFDRGMEIINNLMDNTLQQLIVFGDARIFKAELHSASGNFAKLLFNQEEQEVISV